MKQVERTRPKCGGKESIEKRCGSFIINVDGDKIMKQDESQLVKLSIAFRC